MLPTSASTRRSWTSNRIAPRTNAPIESSGSVRGRNGSAAARSLPLQLSSDVVTNGRTEAGTPSTIPPGIGCSPSCQTIAVAVGRRRHFARPQPDLAGERDGMRHPPQVGVGSFVDVVEPAERRGGDLAAEPIARPPRARRPRRRWREVDEAGGGGEPGDAAADHEHVPAAHTDAMRARERRPSRGDRR